MSVSTATPPLADDCLRHEPVTPGADLTVRREDVDILYIPGVGFDTYRVGYAVSSRAIRRAQQLRFDVFNRELGEGYAASYTTGLDEDRFDEQMTHLVLLEQATDTVIGTYRLQTVEHALATGGVYSELQYDITGLRPYFPQLVECGRACISPPHRNGTAILLLWKGIAHYLGNVQKRWLFGCCSIPSCDTDDGWRALRIIRRAGALSKELALPGWPKFDCGNPAREHDHSLEHNLKLPKLLRTYINLGGQVISLPTIDREFRTIDFLLLLDTQQVGFTALQVK